MRIGYSFWGFLSDYKLDDAGNEISAPDGNATYSWSIVWEAQRRGHTVFSMQDDRDYPAWKRMRADAFASFSKEKRISAYEGLRHTRGETFPELDVLLVEWRFPIPGRNCDLLHSDDGLTLLGLTYDPSRHQPDFHRQEQILRHYKGTKTKIILFDLDHKLTQGDEITWRPDAIFETSVTPRRLTMDRTRVEIPFHIPDLLQHPTLPPDPYRKLVYIGSRYERDEIITEWIKPTSDRYPGEVEFHGNWFKTIDECKALWPNVKFHDRCVVRDFRRIYGSAGACPLLAKKSYLETGFITARLWETLLFGTLPIGLGSAKDIEKYVWPIAQNGEEMIEWVDAMSRQDVEYRHLYRKNNVEKLEFMDARYFVDRIEAVV